MKNLFNDISQEERKRILEMHENATKRNYLFEQGTPTSTSGTPTTNTIASFSPQNPDLYKKFITLNVSGEDFPKLYSFFDPEKKWAGNENTALPFKQMITQSLSYYAGKGKTPSEVLFSEVIKSGAVPKGKEMFMFNGKSTEETNYQKLFGPSKNKMSPDVNVLTTANGGIDSAFKQFFDWKLLNSNV